MSPLFPLGILLAGAGALLLSLLPRAPYAAPTAIGAAALAWVAVALMALDLPASAVFSTWAPTDLLPVGLQFEADGLAWLLALGLMSVSLATLLTGLARPGGRRLAARAAILLLTLAGLAAICAANLVTLVMAWAGLDFVYFIILILLARGEGVQPQAVLHLTFNSLGTLLVLGAVLLLGRQSPDFTWQAAGASAQAVVLLTLAAVFRLGLFPLHLGLPVEANIRQGLGTLLRLIPATIALQAMARLAALGMPEVLRPWLTGFGVIAVLLGSAQLWNSDDPRQGLTFVVIAHSGVALLVGLWGGAQSVLGVALQALALLFGGGLLFLGNGWDSQRPWHTALPGLGVAVLAGLPLTAGFFGWNHVLGAWIASGQWPLWLGAAGLLVAVAFLTGGVLRAAAWPGDPVEGGRVGEAGLVSGLALLGGGALAAGAFAGPIAGLLGAPAPGLVDSWPGLAITLAGVAGGFGLWRLEHAARGRTEAIAEVAMSVLRLAWLYQLVWNAIRLVDRLIFWIAGVLEGEGALLWALAIVLAVLLLFRT